MNEFQILLADDELALRFLIRETLEDEGYHITEAENGDEAVAYMKERAFDLIILDYMMPGLTGIEVCEWMRLNGGDNAHKPVLLLTAKTTEKDKERAIEAGVTQYITKPFSPLQLIETIKTYLPRA